MNLLKLFINEKCPKCNKTLETKHSSILSAFVIKYCSEGHYQKEFHPSLETYIETNKVS
ncbi:hypothetical protein [Litchfieldia salsa]|uniref:Uncharacterized protein n=1 Tax=Litchfieldia salsa TaxID=930152 RepID=A0A1H0T3A0_9BACI|nr:hypothetical protein [Litchfieldia salsa]SDP48523.1 hypothetical protein SAMN05216565_103267 [Litchfieldia salsa]